MEFKLHKKEVMYQGFFRMEKYHVSHALFGGGVSPVFTREMLERGNAVALLPYDPITDQVVLVEQFRIGALKDPHGPWLVETIAGMIEPGETPEEVALREAVEEANCAVDQLIPIAEYYCSPGGCSEKVYLYCARTCVSQMVNGSVHGLQHEAEDIRLHLVAFDELVENYRAGHYQTAMTLIAVQWLLLHRDHVRNVWLG